MTKLPLSQPYDFNKWERMIVLPHIHPDGDTIGSCIALNRFFKTLGLESYVVNNETLPVSLRFLNTEDFIASEAFNNLGWATGSYAVMVVDGSDIDRVADRRDIFNGGAVKLNIDHHVTNEIFADFTWIDHEASSTGELVYELILSNGGVIDMETAEALYVAITTDTGSFKYDNTSPKTHRVVANLLETGFDAQKAIVEVYQNKDLDQVKLMQIALNHLELHNSGKIGLTYICLEDVEKAQIVNYDTDGICESIRDIAGLEVAVFLRETKPEIFKVSTRSKHDFDVAQFSLKYDGGGHKKAAGFTMKMGLKQACDELLGDLKSQVV